MNSNDDVNTAMNRPKHAVGLMNPRKRHHIKDYAIFVYDLVFRRIRMSVKLLELNRRNKTFTIRVRHNEDFYHFWVIWRQDKNDGAKTTASLLGEDFGYMFFGVTYNSAPRDYSYATTTTFKYERVEEVSLESEQRKIRRHIADE